MGNSSQSVKVAGMVVVRLEECRVIDENGYPEGRIEMSYTLANPAAQDVIMRVVGAVPRARKTIHENMFTLRYRLQKIDKSEREKFLRDTATDLLRMLEYTFSRPEIKSFYDQKPRFKNTPVSRR